MAWDFYDNLTFSFLCPSLLLTDGRILAKSSVALEWWILTPGSDGKYTSGNWSQALNSFHEHANATQSTVLYDGSVLISGGEGFEGTNYAEIYYPSTLRSVEEWIEVAPPYIPLSDAPSSIMEDGRVLYGAVITSLVSIFDPFMFQFIKTTNYPYTDPWPDNPTDEATWVLLPDGSVLSVSPYGSNYGIDTKKYLPSFRSWVSAGTSPNLCSSPDDNEIGPGIVLYDGTCLIIGATGITGIYTPPEIITDPGTWAQGPNLPPDPGYPGYGTGVYLESRDTGGSILTNGNFLVCLGHNQDGIVSTGGPGQPDDYFLYEYKLDGSGFFSVQPPSWPGLGPANPADLRFLPLPDGSVLVFVLFTSQYAFYTPDTGSTNPAWKPTITNCTTLLGRGLMDYTLTGTQLCGLSAGQAYGDDYTAATNYPIIRIRHNQSGNVYYCRTYNFSTRSIKPGISSSCSFDVPSNIPLGVFTLNVIANGIASDDWPVSVYQQPVGPPPNPNPPPPPPVPTGAATGMMKGIVQSFNISTGTGSNLDIQYQVGQSMEIKFGFGK